MNRQRQNFLIANSAATAIEYGLIAAMIALAVAAGGYAAGSNLQTAFDKVTDNMATGSIRKSGRVSASGDELRPGSQSDGN